MITLPRRHKPIGLLLGAVTSLAAITATAETLDTLAEYGNAASADATSGAGTPRGFTNPATDEYTITAGGTDFWGGTDHGSYIYDADVSRAAGENFSAVVRSVSIAADPLELLAGEWGRTGLMARADPAAGNSANVAHIRKHGGGANAFTVLQARDATGGGTDRNGGGVTDSGYHPNAVDNTANGGVWNTPIWLGLHRFDGTWYSTWAPDAGGVPGAWSPANVRPGTAGTQGEVYVGLAHQSHNIHPATNTAVFDNFSVDAFDNSLGVFPTTYTCDVTFVGEDVFFTASKSELGLEDQDVNWEVHFLGAPVPTPGILNVDLYNVANNGSNQSTTLAPGATVQIDAENFYWSENDAVNYPPEFAGIFGRTWNTGNEDNYGAKTYGEIFIPSDADRDLVESVRFHDLVDDYTYLEIDGVALINDNTWTDHLGEANGGGAQATLDVSDAKYDDGEWVDFCLVMWEGGGGDHSGVTWDALDRTGADTNTGGVDAALGSYNAGNLADGTQVNFPFSSSDLVPPENFRVVAPSVTIESGTGQPSNMQLTNTLTPDTSQILVYLDGQLIKTIETLPYLVDARFTAFDMATIVISDVPGARVVDETDASFTVTRDGLDVTGSVAITRNGDEVEIVDTFTPDLITIYTYQVSGQTTAATGTVPFSFSATVESYPLPPGELVGGLPTPPNETVGLDHMEYNVLSVLGGLGGGAQMYRDAIFVAQTAVAEASGTIPFLNLTDPETNAASGDWPANLPILRDTPADDNQYVTYSRTVLTIGAAGPRTFRIRSDDGYALRIMDAGSGSDGIFTQVTGNAVNRIHPDYRSTVFYPDGTGDSNAYAVCDFPAAGDYLFEFVCFEGGGGSYQEVSWAPGSRTNTNQTLAWDLIGDSSTYAFKTSIHGVLPTSVIPPLPVAPDNGWSTRWHYSATVGSSVATMNFLRATDPALGVSAIEPVINHSDDNIAGRDGGVFDGADLFYPGDPTVGDTDNIAMIAHGRIMAPVDGDYTIQVRSDDGFVMWWADPNTCFHSFNGAGQLHPANFNEAYFPAGTGDSNTRVAVTLTAGTHDLLFAWWEGGGGSHVEISSAPGVVLAHAAPPYELIGTTPSATNLFLVPGVAGPGPSIADVQFDSVTSEVSVFVDNIPAGETFHLRTSSTFGSPSGDDPADWATIPFDFDDATPQPFTFSVDTGANPTMGFKAFSGPSIP